MLLYNNRKAHLFSLSDVPIYNSILILLQAPPVTVYKPLFFYVSSTILMTAYIFQGFPVLLFYFPICLRRISTKHKICTDKVMIQVIGYDRYTVVTV